MRLANMKPFITPVCPTCHQTVGAIRFGVRLTVKAHVWQINELLEETDWIIRSDGQRWVLSRRGAP